MTDKGIILNVSESEHELIKRAARSSGQSEEMFLREAVAFRLLRIATHFSERGRPELCWAMHTRISSFLNEREKESA